MLEFNDTFVFLRHRTQDVINLVGTDAFNEHFTPTGDSSTVMQHFNSLIEQFNNLSPTALAKHTVENPIRFPPAEFDPGQRDLFSANSDAIAAVKANF